MLSYLSFSLGILLTHWVSLTTLMANRGLILSLGLLIFWRLVRPGPLPPHQRLLFNLNCALLGLCYASWHLANYRAAQVITSIPRYQLTAYLSSPVSHLPNSKLKRAEINVISGHYTGRRLIAYFAESYPIHAGINYQLQVTLHPLNHFYNYAGNDYLELLHARHIIGTAYVKSIPQAISNCQSFNCLLSQWRLNLINYLQHTLATSPMHGIIIALVCGWQGLITNQQWQLFKQTGISHLVCVSGLHLAIVVSMLCFLVKNLMRLLPLLPWPRQQLFALMAILGALAYSALAGFGIATSRSCYQIIISSLLICRRQYLTSMDNLSITLALVLLLEPLAYSNPGFWFSFGLVATIYLSNQNAHHHRFKQWLKLQIALSLVSLPLAVYYFNCYPWIAIVANLIAIPIIGNLITPIIVLASLGQLSWLLKLAAYILEIAFYPLAWLSRAPLWWQTAPNLAGLFIYFCGLICWLIYPRGRINQIIAILLLISIFFPRQTPSPSYANYQINCTQHANLHNCLIQTSTHSALILISQQESQVSQQLTNYLVPYLARQQQTNIDALITNLNPATIDNILLNHQIKLKRPTHHQWYWDGVGFNLYQESQQLALWMTSNGHSNYIGNGAFTPSPAVTAQPKLSNAIILDPSSAPTWLYHYAITNLIISPGQQSQMMHNFVNNLYLNAKLRINLNEQANWNWSSAFEQTF